MEGTMMRSPLTLVPLFERAGKLFPKVEIISRRPDQSIHRHTYGDMYRRARALAAVLQEYGLSPGDRVGTLMWNHYMHLEAYFAVPVVGGVLHTLNLRLHPDELAYIINHAEDRFLIVDDVLLPVFEKIKDRVKLERVIVNQFSGKPPSPHGYEDYEQLLQQSRGEPRYADLDENDALGMCYTSDDGKAQGRRVFTPCHRVAFLFHFAARQFFDFAQRHHPSGDVDVSCQCLGISLRGGHAGQQPGIARAESPA